METHKAILLTGRGGPEVLQLVELRTPDPAPHQVRLRVRATGAGGTDVTMRRGRYIYAPPYPFVPGYEVIGEIEAIGTAVSGFREGDRVAALIVHGGYAERLLIDAAELVRVPEGVDDADAVTMILNYVTAHQALHRCAQLRPGQSALVTGASGGVGSALVELLALHGVQSFAAAAPAHHDFLRSHGATPIDARARPLDTAVRELVPQGVDAALDALGGRFVGQCVRATRRRGVVVAYGFSSTIRAGRSDRLALARGLVALAGAPLRGRKPRFYGITALYRKDKRAFLEDLPRLFELLRLGKVRPKIHARLPLLAAAEASIMLERGGVHGKIVHLAALPA